MTTTINASVNTISLTSQPNDITVNVKIGSNISTLAAFIEGDTFFRINGETQNTGFRFENAGSAIVFYIDNAEVGRFEK